MMTKNSETTIQSAIAWCLAWGDQAEPQHPDVIEQMRQVLPSDRPLPDSAQPFLEQAQQLAQLELPNNCIGLKAIVQQHPNLWNAKIGLVYGGATKIKQYVFETNKLQEIRGASALLDRINLCDLKAFFDPNPSHPARSCLLKENAAASECPDSRPNCLFHRWQHSCFLPSPFCK